MNKHVPRRLIRQVRERAANQCEYCLLPQVSQEATFHIDHIHPCSRGGATELDNLALACVGCSLHKAAHHQGRDPRSGKLVRLYNPRSDDWEEHFAFTKSWRISGQTTIGRATIAVLKMNRTVLVAIRSELAQLGRYPPDVRR